MAVAFVTHSMIAPLVPLLGLSLGASPAVVGALVSAAFVLPLFLAMPAGGLVDRWGARRLITVGAVGLCFAPVSVVLWPSLVALALAQVLIGLAHLVMVVSAQSFVASLGIGEARVVHFGWYTTFLSAGQLAGPLLAGVLADAFGYPPAFAVAGALSLGAVALSRLLEPIKVAPPSRSPSSPYGAPGQLPALLKNEGVKVAIVVSSGVLFAMAAHQAFLPVYLETLAYPATAIGLFISLKALVAMTVRPFMPRIIATLRGRARTLLVVMVTAALGLGMTGFVTSVPAFILIAMMVGAGSGISQPLSMVAMVDHVADEARGFGLGLRLTGNRVAQVSGPLLLGLVAELAGLTVTFVVGASVLLVASGFVARWGPGFERAERALKRPLVVSGGASSE